MTYGVTPGYIWMGEQEASQEPQESERRASQSEDTLSQSDSSHDYDDVCQTPYYSTLWNEDSAPTPNKKVVHAYSNVCLDIGDNAPVSQSDSSHEYDDVCQTPYYSTMWNEDSAPTLNKTVAHAYSDMCLDTGDKQDSAPISNSCRYDDVCHTPYYSIIRDEDSAPTHSKKVVQYSNVCMDAGDKQDSAPVRSMEVVYDYVLPGGGVTGQDTHAYVNAHEYGLHPPLGQSLQ